MRAGTVPSTWCLGAQEVLLFDMAWLTQNPLDHMVCAGGDPVPPSGPIAGGRPQRSAPPRFPQDKPKVTSASGWPASND